MYCVWVIFISICVIAGWFHWLTSFSHLLQYFTTEQWYQDQMTFQVCKTMVRHNPGCLTFCTRELCFMWMQLIYHLITYNLASHFILSMYECYGMYGWDCNIFVSEMFCHQCVWDSSLKCTQAFYFLCKYCKRNKLFCRSNRTLTKALCFTNYAWVE